MGRKKPLDIHPSPLPGEALHRPFPAILFLTIFAVFVALFVFAWAMLPREQASGSGAIELFLLSGSPPVFGSEVKVRAYSTCGSFSLLLDGEQVAEGELRADATLLPASGRHRIEAKNSRCLDYLDFLVLERECTGNETRECIFGACAGEKKCHGGIWGECSLPRKVCVPGEEIGCSLDACRFGHAICNECGSGFGPCLADGNTENSMVCVPQD